MAGSEKRVAFRVNTEVLLRSLGLSGLGVKVEGVRMVGDDEALLLCTGGGELVPDLHNYEEVEVTLALRYRPATVETYSEVVEVRERRK